MLKCLEKCPYDAAKKTKISRMRRDFMATLCSYEIRWKFDFKCFNESLNEMKWFCRTCDVHLIANNEAQMTRICKELKDCMGCLLRQVRTRCGEDTWRRGRIIFGELSKDVYRTARWEETDPLPVSPQSCAELMVDAFLARGEMETMKRKEFFAEENRDRLESARRMGILSRRSQPDSADDSPPKQSSPIFVPEIEPPREVFNPASIGLFQRISQSDNRRISKLNDPPLSRNVPPLSRNVPPLSRNLPPLSRNDPPLSRSVECQPDKNPDCAAWSARGECEKNPGYMKPNCQVSCNCCGCKQEDFYHLYV
jgi:hypothetical protein